MINRFLRKQVWRSYGKGPTGKTLCHCGCGNEVMPPRRTCYSDACLQAWKQHSDPTVIRSIVEQRDRGVCALCGVDTVLRSRVAEETRRLWRWFAVQHATELFWAGQLPMFPGFTVSEKRYAEYRRSAEQGRVTYGDVDRWASHWVYQDSREKFGDTPSGHCWEADHIVPVCEGGGGCGPEGYRTLCLQCHKAETARLAARRAQKRRQSVPQLTLMLP
jgi:5-methylcytosine-specific restriction endonuclease McrA